MELLARRHTQALNFNTLLYQIASSLLLTVLALLFPALLVFFALLRVTVRNAIRLLSILIFLTLFLLCVLLFLLLPVLYLVLDEIMEGCYCPYKTAQVYGHKLIIGLDTHRSC